MGIIDTFTKMKEADRRYKELEIEDRATNKLQQRKQTANERELNRYMEEKRQEQITSALKKIRKQRENELWHKDVISQKNLFNNNKKLFKAKGGNLLK